MKTMKFFLLTALFMLGATKTWAFDFEENGIYYNFIETDPTLVAVTAGDAKYAGDVVIPQTVTHLGKVYDVVKIESWAFRKCEGLTSIDLGQVKALENMAFDECTGLTSVVIPASVDTISYNPFTSCSNLAAISVDSKNTKYDSRNNCNAVISKYLEQVSIGTFNTVIPDGISTIGGNAFAGCTRLKSIDFKDIVYIGQAAFYGCTGLESIDIKNVHAIGLSAFQNCTQLKDINFTNQESVAPAAFKGCTALEVIHLNNVEHISMSVFDDCSGLKAIYLENVPYFDNSIMTNSHVSFIDLGNRYYVPEFVYSMKNSLEHIVFGKVKEIKADAFYDFKCLRTIDLCNVESVEGYAFRGCESLDSIYLNQVGFINFYAFEGCNRVSYLNMGSMEYIPYEINILRESLKSVHLGNVKEIGSSTFWDFKKLESVDLNQVTAIQSSAFESCTNLSLIDFKNVEEIDDQAFRNCLSLKSIDLSSAKHIGKEAFEGCENLTDIHFNQVEVLSDHAFYSCDKLSSVEIPASTKSIGINPFAYCNQLTSIKVDPANTYYDSRNDCNAIIDTKTQKIIVGCAKTTIPDDVVMIGTEVFQGFDALTNMDLKNVKTIGDMAFNNCKKLASVDLKNVSSIGDAAFRNCEGLRSVDFENVKSIGDDCFYSCKNIQSIDLRNLQVIGYGAFYECGKIRSLDLKNVQTIGDYAFSYCNGLQQLDFKNVKKIRDYAFSNCMRLESIQLRSVDSIGMNAFYGCEKLMTVKTDNPTPPMLSNYSFDDNTLLYGSLEVPSGCDGIYQNSEGWKDFYQISEVGQGALYLTLVSAAHGKMSLVVEKDKCYEFVIEAEEGWKVNTLTFNGMDVTADIDANHRYMTPPMVENAVLNVSFEKDVPAAVEDVKDGKIKVRGLMHEIIVEGANLGDKIEVYAVNGALVESRIACGANEHIQAKENQVYVVRVGGASFKLAL